MLYRKNQIELFNEVNTNISFYNNMEETKIVLRDYQKEAVDDILKYIDSTSYAKVLAVLPTGCHAKGYELLKSDNSIINVENIKVGDELLSIGGGSRTVLKLHRGEEQMYKITLRNKVSFEVNGGHLLQLYKTGGNRTETVTVLEYLKWKKYKKHIFKIKRDGFLDFKYKPVLLDPYFLGLWLGDGDSDRVCITTPDKKISQYISKIANVFDLQNSITQKSGSKRYCISKGKYKGIKNRPLLDVFKALNVFNNKHIPEEYLTNSKEVRIELLNGIIDTDGSLNREKGRYEVTFKQKKLATDLYRLVNSLGLQGSLNLKRSRAQSFEKGVYKDYWRVTFRWDKILSPKVPHKRLKEYNFQSKGDMYAFKIEPTSVKRYYGFTLNDDHLYLDKHQIIHHNSGKSHIIAEIIKRRKLRVVVFQPGIELLDQNHNKYVREGFYATKYSAAANEKIISDVTFVTPGSVKNIAESFGKIHLIIIDEAHLMTGTQGMIGKFVKALKGKQKIVGLTATPIKLKSYTNDEGESYSQLNMITKLKRGENLFTKIIHITQIGDLFDQQYLTKVRYTVFPFSRKRLKLKGSDFNAEISSKELDRQGAFKMAINIVKASLERGKKRILIFTSTVRDSERLQKALPYIEIVTSKTKKKERRAIVKRFKEGKTKVLSNYGTLVVGFDVPEVDLIIMLRPTRSYAIYYQMLGRGIRIAEGKDIIDIVDISGNYKTFGKIEELKILKHKQYGWGMFIKNHLISGVPLGSKIHVSQLDWRNKIVTFGKKYKGVRASEVPYYYWEWIVSKWDLDAPYNKRIVVPYLKALGYL